MTWINKTLQINSESYGRLYIHGTSGTKTDDLTLTTFSFVDCGGKYQWNNFSLTTVTAFILARNLYEFATHKKKLKIQLVLEQQYKTRGRLFVNVASNSTVQLSIDRYICGPKGQLSLTKKQAKKLAGYLFFWLGEILIGQRKVKIPAKTKQVFDINDKIG